MSEFGAYWDEMGVSDLTDRDLELLLAGRAPAGPANQELARFVGEVRAAYTQGPAEPIAQAHVAAIAAAAQSLAVPPQESSSVASPPEKPRRRNWRMPRRRLALLTAGVVVGAPLFTAGLAVAGVNLPDVARAPFDQLGIHLPNQASADSVKAVIDSTPTDQRRCSFGQQVAAAANGGKGGPGQDPCSRNGGHGSDTKSGHSFGQQTSARARQSASQEGRAFGQQTSQGAQSLGQGGSSGASQSQTGQGIAQQQSQSGQPSSPGPQVGQQQSQTGQSIGQGRSQAGQGIADQASGGHSP